jgi:hypothetical protein
MALAAGTSLSSFPHSSMAVGSHQGGAVFVTAHDDLQEDFAAFGRQNLKPMSSIMRRSGLRYFPNRRRPSLAGLNGKLARQVEHRPVEHDEVSFDSFNSDGLSQMAFSHPGRANKERVALLADKVTGGQFVDAREIEWRD